MAFENLQKKGLVVLMSFDSVTTENPTEILEQREVVLREHSEFSCGKGQSPNLLNSLF